MAFSENKGVYLYWRHPNGDEVRAAYASVEDAKVQAQHDIEMKNIDIRSIEVDGKVVWRPDGVGGR